mmetsp:Transcript_41514/g.48172  ORF Transcript_41514/g.48172 Transcript_41514/m.48172 type:complete len:154 (-) Transcript_41514:318-779(-)
MWTSNRWFTFFCRSACLNQKIFTMRHNTAAAAAGPMRRNAELVSFLTEVALRLVSEAMAVNVITKTENEKSPIIDAFLYTYANMMPMISRPTTTNVETYPMGSLAITKHKIPTKLPLQTPTMALPKIGPFHRHNNATNAETAKDKYNAIVLVA